MITCSGLRLKRPTLIGADLDQQRTAWPVAEILGGNERLPEMCQISSVPSEAPRYRGCHTPSTEPKIADGCQNSGLHISFSKCNSAATRCLQGPAITQYCGRLTGLLVCLNKLEVNSVQRAVKGNF